MPGLRPFHLLTLLLLHLGAGAAAEPVWTGFYDGQNLLAWQGRMRPGIEENFREVIWPALTAEERRAIGRVNLDFPLENASHPMNFYADAAQGRIVLPVSSLGFLRDIVLAYSWLNATGHSIDPITDYLAMLKYQWPSRLAGRRHRPRDVLGIPDDATANPRVSREFQQLFGTAVVFIIGHELGHLRYRHPVDVTPEQSRGQEEEADRFAMELMRRISAAPMGMVQVFSIFSHLGRYSSDPGTVAGNMTATHPLGAERLRALASGIDANLADFARTGTSTATLAYQARQLREFALLFEDPGVQNLIRQKGLTANPDLLFPRKAGVSVVTAPVGPGQAGSPFSGNYRGKWLNTRGTDFDVSMSLTRQGDSVRGSYNFGAGNITIEGAVTGKKLSYNWKWGTEYFGKGVLELDEAGEAITGTWGYTRNETGAGTWNLHRAE